MENLRLNFKASVVNFNHIINTKSKLLNTNTMKVHPIISPFLMTKIINHIHIYIYCFYYYMYTSVLKALKWHAVLCMYVIYYVYFIL